MNVKLKLNTAAALSLQGQLRYHAERADYYCNKFNALPFTATGRREVAQRLCESHSTRAAEIRVELLAAAGYHEEGWAAA